MNTTTTTIDVAALPADAAFYFLAPGHERLQLFCVPLSALPADVRERLPADCDCLSTDHGPAVVLEVGKRAGDVVPLRAANILTTSMLTTAWAAQQNRIAADAVALVARQQERDRKEREDLAAMRRHAQHEHERGLRRQRAKDPAYLAELEQRLERLETRPPVA